MVVHHKLTRVSRMAIRAFFLLSFLALLSGCDPTPYPVNLSYPDRNDLLVLNADGRDIPNAIAPGQLDEFINGLRKKAKEDPSKFSVADPQSVSDKDRDTIALELVKRFGTPAAPIVKADEAIVKELKIDTATLTQGSVLYRRHCVQCHGIAGDGRGLAAAWVNPPPRDYRRGLFKFASVVGSKKSKPQRADLIRTLQQGIEGTSMPSFKLLAPSDLEALVSYVIHLSIRGAVEFDALSQVVRKTEDSKNLSALIEEKTKEYTDDWQLESMPITAGNAEPKNRLHPYPYDPKNEEQTSQSVARGYTLFVGKAICISCHTDFGRRAGFMFDDWGTLVRPNDLTKGIYRGGSRAIDIYFRIHSGIQPSKMPGQPEEIQKDPKAMWDLVNFVQALPYPSRLPEAVRLKVYGKRSN